MFEVKERYTKEPSNNVSSLHISTRFYRTSKYKYLMSTKFIDMFIVDTGHLNGLEIHCINEYGLIYIYNKDTGKLITILHPRPMQLKRYYIQLELTISKEIREIINICYNRNLDRNLNQV